VSELKDLHSKCHDLPHSCATVCSRVGGSPGTKRALCLAISGTDLPKRIMITTEAVLIPVFVGT
jgi:hypothetical protein